MAKITIEEKDWERMQKSVKKHDEEITRLRQKVQPSPIDTTSTPPNLTSLQSDIFRFVSEHPHCNKADVIDDLKDRGSRATVFKAIDILVEYGLIIDGINEINRQTHSLVVNNDSELSLLIQELDRFEKAYLSLIDRLKERFKDLENENKYSSFQKYGAFEDILSIYQFVLGAYLMKGIYIWPRKISDDELLSKLYTILFTRMSQMQLALIMRSRVIFEQYDLVENMILNSSTLPVSKDALLKSSKKFDYGEELDGVLQFVDNIGSEVKKAAFRSSGGRIRIGGRGNRVYSPIIIPGKGKVS